MRKSILQSMPPRPAPRDLRASDSDRERVVAILGEALADGRLSHEEHAERMPRALTARTLGDLAGLTRDLVAPEHQPLQLDGGQQVTALFTSADRRGFSERSSAVKLRSRFSPCRMFWPYNTVTALPSSQRRRSSL